MSFNGHVGEQQSTYVPKTWQCSQACNDDHSSHVAERDEADIFSISSALPLQQLQSMGQLKHRHGSC